MTVVPITAERARRTLLVLSFTRWFPVGLIIGLTALLMLQRGMGLTEIGLILATQGVILLVLELPTGGLADAIGRRPVLVLAGIISLISAVLFVTAHTLVAFVVATALQGIFRALDSGPLEAWYVDTAQADDPAVPVRAGTLSRRDRARSGHCRWCPDLGRSGGLGSDQVGEPAAAPVLGGDRLQRAAPGAGRRADSGTGR